MLVTVFQVKKEMTRSHGFASLEVMEEYMKQGRNAYDMSAYEVVFGELSIGGFPFFPRIPDELIRFLYEVTNDPRQQEDKETLVDYFKFRGRSISISDIIKIDDEYYYCNLMSWEKITPKKGTVPNWIYEGMRASGSYFSDIYPFEVIKVTPSGKTVTIREMNATLVKGSDFDGTAEYVYTSNPNGETHTVRRDKFGRWKTPNGMKVSFGSARKYRDPHF